jgi:ribosomal protein L7/L12
VIGAASYVNRRGAYVIGALSLKQMDWRVEAEDTPMLFAVLEFTDFAIIAAIVAVLTGGAAAARATFGLANRDRLARVEQKLDLLLTHAGLDYTPAPKSAWQALADEGPSRKIAAIKAYRDETGVALAEAKRAVEDYIEGRR